MGSTLIIIIPAVLLNSRANKHQAAINFNLFQMEAPMFKQEEYRSETDAFGEISVPRDKYFGASTARAIINFSIGDESERMPVS